MNTVELSLNLNIISWDDYCQELLDNCDLDQEACILNRLSKLYYKTPKLELCTFESDKSLSRLAVELQLQLPNLSFEEEGLIIPSLNVSQEGMLYIDLLDSQLLNLLDLNLGSNQLFTMRIPVTYVVDKDIPMTDTRQLDYIGEEFILQSGNLSKKLTIL